MLHILEHSLEDLIPMLPFLFLTYLLMEYIEHRNNQKFENLLARTQKLGPLIGSLLGIIPQCGFSVIASGLYMNQSISLGTLLAVFIATSDDAIPIASKPDFIPILSWYANVSLVKWIQKGQSVSYGRHFIATKPTKVATVSVGYADGLHRLVSNCGLEVLIHGQKCLIIGNVCMDQCMVDVTQVDDVKEGDVVVLVGKQGDKQVTIDEISRKSHTINNETLSDIAARVPRLKRREK